MPPARTDARTDARPGPRRHGPRPPAPTPPHATPDTDGGAHHDSPPVRRRPVRPPDGPARQLVPVGLGRRQRGGRPPVAGRVPADHLPDGGVPALRGSRGGGRRGGGPAAPPRGGPRGPLRRA